MEQKEHCAFELYSSFFKGRLHTISANIEVKINFTVLSELADYYAIAMN